MRKYQYTQSQETAESTIIQGRALYIYMTFIQETPLSFNCKDMWGIKNNAATTVRWLYTTSIQKKKPTHCNYKSYGIPCPNYRLLYIYFMATLSHLSSTLWVSIQLVSNVLPAATFASYAYNITRPAMYV